jgi:hypothetical protein
MECTTTPASCPDYDISRTSTSPYAVDATASADDSDLISRQMRDLDPVDTDLASSPSSTGTNPMTTPTPSRILAQSAGQRYRTFAVDGLLRTLSNRRTAHVLTTVLREMKESIWHAVRATPSTVTGSMISTRSSVALTLHLFLRSHPSFPGRARSSTGTFNALHPGSRGDGLLTFPIANRVQKLSLDGRSIA